MHTLRLDFHRHQKPVPVAGWLLLAVALAIAGGAAHYYFDHAEQLATWEAKAGQMERLARRHGIGTPADGADNERLADELAQANEVLRRISLPWERLFQAVESAAAKDVALLGLDPDAQKQTVKIVGEAKNIGAVLAYLRRLQGHQAIGKVRLTNHQLQRQDPEHPIRFSLIATWKSLP